MKSHIYSITLILWALLFIIPTSYCSAASSNGVFTHAKLTRARREVANENVYFIETRDEIDPYKYVTEMAALQKNRTFDGYHFELQGIATGVAHGFSAVLSLRALTELANDDRISHIYQDHKIKGGSALPSPSPSPSPSSEGGSLHKLSSNFSRIVHTWGLDRLDQKDTQYNANYTTPCGLTGKGVDVYVLDSGIMFNHLEFQGRALNPGCDPIDSITKTNKSGWDCTGHGSHVAGTIGGATFGVASGATIFSVRVLDCKNSGTSNSVILGAECVLKSVLQRKRPSIVNLSIYGDKSLPVKRALDTLMRKGVTIVSIAGNSDKKPRDSCKVAPGSIQGVITASASTRNDRPYMYSNAGVCVDLYAPGTQILSVSKFCKDCRSTRQGSSMAAPHVTGAIALLLEKCPNIPPWRVRHLLLSQMTIPNRLDFTKMPKIYKATTPNLLLHTSSLDCNMQC